MEREKVEVQQRVQSLDAVGDKKEQVSHCLVRPVCCMTGETNEIHIQDEWERERDKRL